jgi:hypothetical protein
VYVATNCDGGFIHEGTDLAALVRWVLEILPDGSGDALVLDGGQVVAVLRRDTLTAVYVREGGAS